MKINSEEIKKILCIKPRGIGDIVLSTIILDSLKNAFPNSEIHYLTEHFAKQSLSNNPLITKVLTMGKKDFPLKTALKIRKEKYDLLLDLWSNPRSAQITFLSGVKLRAGFAYRGRKYAYNILATSERGDYHSAEHNLKILEALNIPITSKRLHFYVDENDFKKAKEFIANNFLNEKIIGIIPAGGWESKRCDKEKWVSICKEIIKSIDVKFLILWGPGDEIDAEFIKANLSQKAVLAPSTELKGMTALMKHCSLIIANDSGPMHISAAIGLPTLGIFGPTNPKAHGPYSQNSDYIIKDDLFCIVCNLLVCPYNHECMKMLNEKLIVEKVKNLLAN